MKGFLRICTVVVLSILVGWCDRASASTFTTLWAFTNGLDGSTPVAGLVQGSDGNLYGTASGGGIGFGNVFRVASSNSLTPLYEFTDGSDGSSPLAGLIQATDGKFYGTASEGGTGNNGVAYKITSAGTFTAFYRFAGGNDGSDPEAPLVQGTDTNLYGTANSGGNGSVGTVFKMTTGGAITPLHSFGGGAGGPDGANPTAGLVQGIGTNQTFYGTTSGGGTNFYGTVFKITGSSITNLWQFSGHADGGLPYGGLVMGSDSNFYGTTSEGGTNACACGTVFRITTNGVLTTLYSFSDGTDGATPNAGLVRASDGFLYGTTEEGGTNANGTIFQISSTGSFSNLYLFTGGMDGANPEASLIQGTNSNFYGTTSAGGINDNGTVFEFSFSGSSGGCNSNFMPQVTAIQIVGSNTVVTVPTVPCQTYQLQYTSLMVPTNWFNTGSTVPGTGSPIQLTDLGGAVQTQRFYRVDITP